MQICKKTFIDRHNNTVYKYEIKSKHQMEVHILSLGASLYEIKFPSSLDDGDNVLLTLEHPEDYLQNTLYTGASLGPVAGRIANAKLPIENAIYQLSQNDGLHNLHGGYHNISFMNWSEDSFIVEDGCAFLTLSCTLSDGQDGYPGNRKITVTYSFMEDHTLSIHYEAISDKHTYFNLSNHSYFNLDGNYHTSGLLQKLYSPANYYTYNNSEHICLGMKPVDDTPFDFRSTRSFQDYKASYPKNEQLLTSKGYNHSLVLSTESTPCIKHALTLSNAKETRSMELFTDAPCIVIYSGGYINDTTMLKGSIKGIPSCAIALEAQDLPNSPWVNEFSYQITKPWEIYERNIILRFHEM